MKTKIITKFLLLLTVLTLLNFEATSCKSSNKSSDLTSEIIGYYNLGRVLVSFRNENGTSFSDSGAGSLDVIHSSQDNKISIRAESTIDGHDYSYTTTGYVDDDGTIQFDPIEFRGFEVAGIKLSNKHHHFPDIDITVTQSSLKLHDGVLSGTIDFTAYDFEEGRYCVGTVNIFGNKIY